MENEKGVFRQRLIILLALFDLLLFATIAVLWFGKVSSFEFCHRYHSPVADTFFKYFTYLGDGLFIVLLIIIFVSNRKYVLASGILGGYVISGLIAQMGKKIFQMPRPKLYFESIGQTVYQVPGVDMFSNGSFPSGHTATAFALAVYLILILPYKWFSWLILTGAILVGFSRIYLSEHFPTDVVAGAIIGTVSAFIIFYLTEKGKLNNKLLNMENR